MSAVVHLALVAAALVGSVFAWLVVGLTLADVLGGAAAVIGLLLYLRPIEIFEDGATVRTGGHHVR